MVNNRSSYILKINALDNFVWLVLDPMGKVLKTAHYTDIDSLPKLKLEQKLIVLLPGQSIFMAAVDVPKTSRQNLVKALPFLLEEKIATDVLNLHIIAEKISANHYMAAAIDEKQFVKYFELIKRHGLSPRALMPDFMALAYDPDSWTIWLSNDYAVVRTGLMSGFTTREQNLRLTLELYKKLNDTNLVQTCRVFARSGEYDALKFSRISKQQFNLVMMDQLPEFDLNLFSQAPKINFLNSKYRFKRQSTNIKKYWRLAVASMGLWLICLVGGKIILSTHYQHYNNKQQAKIDQIDQRLLPGQSVSDPRAEITQQITSLLQSRKQDDFEAIVAAVGAVISSSNQLELKSINYQDQQLTLTVSSEKLSTLGVFSRALESHGLVIKQNQVSTGTNTVVGQLVVARKPG